MARKKTEIMALRPDVPIYPIGVAAKLLNVHPRTLRIYEAEGLIKPAHIGSKRMFSANDIQWITCLRTFIHQEGISIPGLKKLLEFAPCFEIAGCPSEIHAQCTALVDRSAPRVPHRVGDAAALAKAKETDQERRKQGEGQKKKRQSS
jgi:MerR family transcriptional regulator, heat shock protein HspR